MLKRIWPKTPIWCGAKAFGLHRFQLPSVPIIWKKAVCWPWQEQSQHLKEHRAWLDTVWPRQPFINWRNHWLARTLDCHRIRWLLPFCQSRWTHRWIASGCQTLTSPHGHHWNIWLSMFWGFFFTLYRYRKTFNHTVDSWHFHCLSCSTFTKWTKGETRPESGSLIRVITKDFQTDLVVAE